MELGKKPYEISIWDDVWNEKGYYEEQKVCNIGSNNMTTPIRAFNPKMVSNINGSNTFTFDLNFRYWDDNLGDFVENPFVSLLYNERKIKVREGTPPNAKWYDLIIKNVTENSEKKVFTYIAKDQYINELSKTGYELIFDDQLENSIGTVNELASRILEGSDWKVKTTKIEDGKEKHIAIFQETQEEPLYEINPILKDSNSLEVIPVNLEGEESTSIPYKFDRNKDKIYGFYSDIMSQSSKVQILIINGPLEVDEDNIIVNGRNYYINTTWEEGLPAFASEMKISTYRGKRYVKQTGLHFDEKIKKYVSVYETKPKDAEGNIIIPEVGTPQWEKRHVFSKTKYLNPAFVQSSIVNPRALDGLTGWRNHSWLSKEEEEELGLDDGNYTRVVNGLQAVIKEIDGENGEKEFLPCFERTATDVNHAKIYVNTGLTDNLNLFPDGIKAGEKYCLSLRCGQFNDSKILNMNKFCTADQQNKENYSLDSNGCYTGNIKSNLNNDKNFNNGKYYYNNLLVSIVPITYTNGIYEHGNTIMNSWQKGYGRPPIVDDNDRITFVMTCFNSLSFEDLKDVINQKALILYFSGADSNNGFVGATEKNHGFCFTDVQFFPYMTDKSGKLIRPGEIPPQNGNENPPQDGNFIPPQDGNENPPQNGNENPPQDENSQLEKEYYSYNPNDNYTKEEEIKFEVFKNELPSDYRLVIDSRHPYEKKRTLRASKSNRFNLISELCELFECWVKFEVERDNNTGKISLDEKGKPKKWVRFYDYKDIETQNYVGFKYGINLKSINRNIESDVIASKLIVENNSNEFAEDGFCSISRASLNPTGENFLFDFNYYIRKKLLDAETITSELDTYYNSLRTENDKRDEWIQKSSGLSLSIIKNESQVQSYGLLQTESSKEAEKLKTEVKQISGKEWKHTDNINSEDLLIKSKVQAIKYASSRADMYKQLAEKASFELEKNKLEYNSAQAKLEEIANNKKELNLAFYTKYSRFIQEGSWISEDYTDDNLYYLDAQGTLHASAFPKVNYTIDIIDVSQIEGFENFNFSLGEKTTVEDVEFFGWALDNSGRPYKEEVIISEITTFYDSPEQDKIKVQNYKTDFEDLFQRITTSTQKLEYKTGSYNKASSILNSDGTIKESVLQGSLNNSSVILSNAADSTVIWDASGIVTWSTADPNQKLIFGNGGIFMISGKDAAPRLMLSGAGLNADYIRAGKIDVDLIRIMSAEKPTFGWDSRGISAYYFKRGDTGEVINYNPNIFIRLDQYGLYGIKGDASFDAALTDSDGAIGIEKIRKHANFSLTWDGFQIKSATRNKGYVSITEDNDFQVFNNDKCVLKIGQLAGTEDDAIFGLRMMDSGGNISLEQTNDGKLWLRDCISIGPINSDGALVEIGYLSDSIQVKEEQKDGTIIEKTYHEVFNANKRFIVYENGKVKAIDGEFEGNISANSGSIGGFEIANDELYSVNKKLILNGKEGTIEAKAGYIGGFKIEEDRLVSTEEGAQPGNEKIILDGYTGSIHVESGYFAGTIEADSGTFKGDITAEGGTIGGFDIDGDRIVSQEKITITTIDEETGEEQKHEEPALILTGNGESVIGGFRINGNSLNSRDGGISLKGNENTIVIGQDKNKISLYGNEGRIVIEKQDSVSNTSLAAIILDAGTGSIYSRYFDNGLGLGWSINENEAIFNNITARGSIKASVFEYGEVQAIGGILLVRPSSRILSQSSADSINFTFKVESTVGFNTNDICLITPSPIDKVYFQISQIEESSTGSSIIGKITENYAGFSGDYTGMPIVNLGQSGSVGIGINASTNASTVSGESISVFEFKIDSSDEADEYYSLNPHIILGKIPEGLVYKDLAGSYGLYADNVLLNGSLITKSSDFGGISSGIRTLSYKENAPFSISAHFPAQQGQILIWAGAPTDGASDAENIPQAKFYVDQHGQLHAHGAHFSGSVMSEATITASEIKTATIVGTGYNSTDGTAALTIKDAYEGIVFSGFKISGDEEETVFFEVATDKLISRTSLVELQSNVIRTSGDLQLGSWEASGFAENMTISQWGLSWDLEKTALKYDDTNNSINFKVNNTPVMNLEPEKIKVQNSVSYQEKMVYSPVKEVINGDEQVIGYNLYVY